MADEHHPVEMVRLPREEQVFEREAVLGRDASSVFPTESAATAGADAAATKASLGALRFITESELEAVKAERGGRVEDGAVAPSKPLAEVLREAKEAKEEAFQAMWRQMKTGKNRPLDPDEAEFMDAIAERDRTREASARAEDATAMEAYQLAVREAAERRANNAAAAARPAPAESSPAAPPAAAPPAPPPRRPMLAVRTRVKVKPAAAQPAAAADGAQAAAPTAVEPAGKRRRVESADDDGVGLAGLVGGYGSDSSGG